MTEKKKRRTIPDPPRLTSWTRDDGSEHAVMVEWEVGGGIFCRGATKDAADEKARLHIQKAEELAIGRVKAAAARLEGRIRKKMEAGNA